MSKLIRHCFKLLQLIKDIKNILWNKIPLIPEQKLLLIVIEFYA
jgi:hypothetical protein